jgi:hypothetical protein
VRKVVERPLAQQIKHQEIFVIRHFAFDPLRLVRTQVKCLRADAHKELPKFVTLSIIVATQKQWNSDFPLELKAVPGPPE